MNTEQLQRAGQPIEYFVTAAEASKFLKLNVRTVLKMARLGTLPAHPIGGGARKTWRFLLSELADWLRGRGDFGAASTRTQ